MTGHSPGERLGLVVYGVVAGIAASALGAWASSRLAGSARIAAWLAVTAVLALSFAWFAERVVLLLIRCLRYGFDGRPLSR